MAILKPSSTSPNNISVDILFPITISWVNQGDRQYSYQIKIYDNPTSTLAYDSTKITSFNSFHIVPEGTLINGIQYKYQITVWNQNNVSAVSEWVLFKCSTTPTIQFANVAEDDYVYNNSYLFTVSYAQAESVPIKSWKMIIYDESMAVLAITDEIFSEIIEYQFSGLNNNTIYYIECQARSQDNLLASTDKVKFNVQYEVPEAVIELETKNLAREGATQLQWNISQIIGESLNTSFIGGEKIDATNGKVWFNGGFNIKNDFTLKLWIESVENSIYIINENALLIASNIEPETTQIWLDDENQITELPLNISVGNLAPSTDSLWIHDETIIPKALTAIIDFTEPIITNRLWVDTGSQGEADTSELLTMLTDNNDEILLRYFNGAFHLYGNGIEVASETVNSTNYFLYIQQINGVLSLHAEDNL